MSERSKHGDDIATINVTVNGKSLSSPLPPTPPPPPPPVIDDWWWVVSGSNQ